MKTLLPEIDSADKRFHNGNPTAGEQGTRVTDIWLNDVQDRVRDVQAEAHYVLLKAGFTPKAETQTQLYQAIVKIIDDNRKSGNTTQKGEVRLTSDTGLDSEELGLTAKAGKILSQAISAVRLALNNYIPLNKRSSAVNSTSNENVATSAAVKTAYDKGVEAKTAADAANQNANGRIPQKVGDCEFTAQADGNFVVRQGGKVKYHLLNIVDTLLGKLNKAGDTMTGNLAIKNGSDWSQVKLYNAAEKELRFESLPDAERNFAKLSYRSPNGLLEYFYALFPKRNGVVAFNDEFVGEVAFFARSTPPSGWLKANGAAVSRTTYAALFAAIGTTFGAGDGRTTFNLPDLRGEFLRGLDDGRNVDGGRALGSYQPDEIKSHNHATNWQVATEQGYKDNEIASSGGYREPAHFRLPTENTGGKETRPRNIALLACIKY